MPAGKPSFLRWLCFALTRGSRLTGSFGGALINSYLSDKIGRKWCIVRLAQRSDRSLTDFGPSRHQIISGWVWVLGCIIQAASFNVRTLVAGRVVAGLAVRISRCIALDAEWTLTFPTLRPAVSQVGLGSAIVTIYQAEITRPAIRGRIVATQQLAITFSELLQYFVSFGCSYITVWRPSESCSVTLGANDRLRADRRLVQDALGPSSHPRPHPRHPHVCLPRVTALAHGSRQGGAGASE
jgi:MFS family permease